MGNLGVDIFVDFKAYRLMVVRRAELDVQMPFVIRWSREAKVRSHWKDLKDGYNV